MRSSDEWVPESDELDNQIKQSARMTRRPRVVESTPKIPIDDYHICPFCEGKGFVNIIEEKAPPPRPKW